MGAFIPITEATYWSDSLGEARQTSQLVAINHARRPDPGAASRRRSVGGLGGSAGCRCGRRPAQAPAPEAVASDAPPPTADELGW